MEGLPIFDPTDVPHIDSWFPANEPAAALVACLEACKDMTRLVNGLDPASPLADARGLTLLATPLISFADNVCALNTLLSKVDRSTWPNKDREALRESSRAMNRARMGPLRTLRSKRSAHHDRDALAPSSGVPRPTPGLFLSAICHGLRCLILLLNHDRTFWWTRSAPNEPTNTVTIFGEVATTFRLDASRQISEIESISITPDPRYSAKRVIEMSIAKYNRLVEISGDRIHPKIVLRDTSNIARSLQV